MKYEYVRVQLTGLSRDGTECNTWIMKMDKIAAKEYVRKVMAGKMKDPFGRPWPKTVAYIIVP